MGNGVANIIAALIIAGAIVGSNAIGNGKSTSPVAPSNQDEFDAWFARAVGDIRNDIVVNCGCCGEGNGVQPPRKVPTRSF